MPLLHHFKARALASDGLLASDERGRFTGAKYTVQAAVTTVSLHNITCISSFCSLLLLSGFLVFCLSLCPSPPQNDLMDGTLSHEAP